MYKKTQHIHFVGIGGIGMSGIAELLLNLGYAVSGSDLRDTAITRRLAGLGGKVHTGHQGEWIAGADVVVISSAVRENNPEVQAARTAHIPVIPRAEMLAELMRLKKYGIAVAGSHGKTTTTSMVGWLLSEAGLDPTVVIGGKVNSLGTNAKLGEGEFLVAEADESDGSFLKLSPVLEIVTNIDLEHLDHYHDIEEIKAAFLDFIEKLPFYGAAVVCLDDAHVASVLAQIRKRVITYGLTSQADVHARAVVPKGLTSTFELCRNTEVLGEITLNVPGQHNVYNALAAITVALELDIPFAVIRAALKTFSGVQRRLQIKGEVEGVMVIDDYGHHPTEIKATLAAFRGKYPNHKIICVFQPHQAKRLEALFKEFQAAFSDADTLILLPIYKVPGRDNPKTHYTSELLARTINPSGHLKEIRYLPSPTRLKSTLQLLVTNYQLPVKTVIVMMGAGDIVEHSKRLLN